MSYVVVRLSGGRFGLPMSDVAEVGRLPWLTRVPGTPEWVAGVANWRGRILGVLDLRMLLSLGGGDVQATAASRLVLLSRAQVTVGVVAERVEGVIEVDEDAVDPALVTLSADAGTLLRGQVQHEGEPVALIDTSAVFALRGRIPSVRRAG